MITSISISHTVLNCLPLQVSYINSLPNDRILNLSKFKAFADDIIIVTQILKLVLERLENIVGKGQMLVTSIFSFSKNVFRSFQRLSFPEVLNMEIVFYSVNPFPHNDTFWRPWEISLQKTLWEKEKLLAMSNFSFSHIVFYPFG